MISELDIVLRLVAACIFGGIVGYERQSRNKSAGLRTHILVSLGSCLVMILSININIGAQFSGRYKRSLIDYYQVSISDHIRSDHNFDQRRIQSVLRFVDFQRST